MIRENRNDRVYTLSPEEEQEIKECMVNGKCPDSLFDVKLIKNG